MDVQFKRYRAIETAVKEKLTNQKYMPKRKKVVVEE